MIRVNTIFATMTLSLLLFNSCALKPFAYQPKRAPIFEGSSAINSALVSSNKIQLNGWFGPEDILFDDHGNLYTGVHNEDFSDGKILKIDPTGHVQVFFDAGSWCAGLHFDRHGNLIVLSHKQGLICISPNKKVTVLASEDEYGMPFLIPNGLDIGDDGMIYFSNTSEFSKYNIKYGRKMIMEMNPIGGLFSYNPITSEVKTLIKGTYFGNGITVSKNQEYLLMVETTKYRVVKYWLTTEKAGETDIFIDNLHGFPNGISIREDGSYWLGFSTKRNEALDNIHPKPGIKKLVYALPEIVQPKAELFGMVMNISEEGEILRTLYDPSGKVIPEAGAVKEYDGNLYIGGDVIPYIGQYKL